MKHTAYEKQTNNFERIKDIPTELLYGTVPKHPVFLTIILITCQRFGYFTEAVASILKQKKVDFVWDIVVMDNDADFENTQNRPGSAVCTAKESGITKIRKTSVMKGILTAGRS